jgi:hypothetical protein
MEIRECIRQFVIERIIDLIEKSIDGSLMLVFYRDDSFLLNGMGKKQFMPRAGLTTMGIELTMQSLPNPQQKKSPSGVSTDGVSSSSQYILRTISRRTKKSFSVRSVTVIQICWIIPGP